MNPEINRRKTAMVLHELEIALGNYVVSREQTVDNISDKLIQDIASRELSRNRIVDIESITDVIEATYLDELFQIILDITKDTASDKYIKKLKELFIIYDIYEIRNIISHPNRKFIDTYWYKVASISSDPLIDILGMDEVKRALISAENGDITDPPEEWLDRVIWKIPNNIPEKFDHDITGLVGRQKESELLLKSLKNPRVTTMALVAPGGLGKTALALDLINEQMSLPETKAWCDACLFISLKTEKLTSEGVKKLDAVETIAEIKELLALEAAYLFDEDINSFDAFTRIYKEEKILLFIDNLETLLVDSPEDFEKFNYDLPATWRVLVTSRISISNASITSLNPLQDKSAALMARLYSTRRGGKQQNGEIYEKIANRCHCNPLAIRLTVDLFLSGKEIPDSIDVANKEIANFSYNNLIDNISETSIKILEALFVDDGSSRLDLCEILGLTKEELAVGIAELSNTSLINRIIDEDKETFNLSGSIRELLLINARNISVRNEIQAKISKKKVLARQIDNIQESQKLPWYHWDYIPTDTNESLKILLTEFNNATTRGFKIRSEKQVYLYKKFKDVEHIYERNASYQRAYARILSDLKAKDDAIIHFKKSIELDDNNPNGKLFLAMLYHNHCDYDSAENIYSELIENGWGDVNEDEKQFFAYHVNSGYMLSLLYGLKHDVILEKTKNWNKSRYFRGMLGAYRASAWKRKSENMVNTDTQGTIKCLTSSIRILDDIFTNDGYIKSACVQAKNIFNEVAYCLVRKEYKDNIEFANEALNFIAKHISNTTEHAKFSEQDSATKLIKSLSEINIKGNPFFKGEHILSQPTYFLNGIDESDITKLSLIKTKIKHIPKGRNSGPNTFIFTTDELSQDYFVHYDKLVNGSWGEWSKLKEGDQIAIKPDSRNPRPGKAISVIEVHFIST
ncbi:NB-ARC domain-containing protein [Aeromonas rivipollensis]|uniref:tetratricopeptide repeat protein n=1 Tax=Aeromonas rivipollensis TaxID=948519 RepID=UPI0027D9A2EE|nr:NB-ARC domain-containing protein [uncultured Aeromonas sp.]MDU1142276.1 NB-ARC domain-containing protein [Aeromonas hydrophila]